MANKEKIEPFVKKQFKIYDFPKIKTTLWNHCSTRESSFFLNLFPEQKSKVHIKEHILGEAAHLLEQNRTGKMEVFFAGTLSLYKGSPHQMIVITLNRLCRNRLPCFGEIFVPVTLVSKIKGKCEWNEEDYLKDLNNLRLYYSISRAVDFSNCIKLKVICSMYGIKCDVHAELLSTSTAFFFIPIHPISIICSELVESLSSNDSLNEKVTTGFITIDKDRCLFLLSENESECLTYPLIGIWTSGSVTVQHPMVFASCMRYISCLSYKNRICLPPLPFLIVHFSPQNYLPKFFNCVCTSKEILKFQLDEGDSSIALAKVPILKTKLVRITLKGKDNEDFKAAAMKLQIRKVRSVYEGLIISNDDQFPKGHSSPSSFTKRNLDFEVPDLSFSSDEDKKHNASSKAGWEEQLQNSPNCSNILPGQNDSETVLVSLLNRTSSPILESNHKVSYDTFIKSAPEACEIASENVQTAKLDTLPNHLPTCEQRSISENQSNCNYSQYITPNYAPSYFSEHSRVELENVEKLLPSALRFPEKQPFELKSNSEFNLCHSFNEQKNQSHNNNKKQTTMPCYVPSQYFKPGQVEIDNMKLPNHSPLRFCDNQSFKDKSLLSVCHSFNKPKNQFHSNQSKATMPDFVPSQYGHAEIVSDGISTQSDIRFAAKQSFENNLDANLGPSFNKPEIQSHNNQRQATTSSYAPHQSVELEIIEMKNISKPSSSRLRLTENSKFSLGSEYQDDMRCVSVNSPIHPCKCINIPKNCKRHCSCTASDQAINRNPDELTNTCSISNSATSKCCDATQNYHNIGNQSNSEKHCVSQICHTQFDNENDEAKCSICKGENFLDLSKVVEDKRSSNTNLRNIMFQKQDKNCTSNSSNYSYGVPEFYEENRGKNIPNTIPEDILQLIKKQDEKLYLMQKKQEESLVIMQKKQDEILDIMQKKQDEIFDIMQKKQDIHLDVMQKKQDENLDILNKNQEEKLCLIQEQLSLLLAASAHKDNKSRNALEIKSNENRNSDTVVNNPMLEISSNKVFKANRKEKHNYSTPMHTYVKDQDEHNKQLVSQMTTFSSQNVFSESDSNISSTLSNEHGVRTSKSAKKRIKNPLLKSDIYIEDEYSNKKDDCKDKATTCSVGTMTSLLLIPEGKIYGKSTKRHDSKSGKHSHRIHTAVDANKCLENSSNKYTNMESCQHEKPFKERSSLYETPSLSSEDLIIYSQCDTNSSKKSSFHTEFEDFSTLTCSDSGSSTLCSSRAKDELQDPKERVSSEFYEKVMGNYEKILSKQKSIAHRNSLPSQSEKHPVSSPLRRNSENLSYHLEDEEIKKIQEQVYRPSTHTDSGVSEEYLSKCSLTSSQMSREFKKLADKYLDEDDYLEVRSTPFQPPNLSNDSFDYLNKHGIYPKSSTQCTKQKKF